MTNFCKSIKKKFVPIINKFKYDGQWLYDSGFYVFIEGKKYRTYHLLHSINEDSAEIELNRYIILNKDRFGYVFL